MDDIMTKILVPLGILLTFIASVLTIYFTRKNLKTSKYIDTITSERIKWMEKVRIELADIVAELQEFIRIKYSLYILTENPNYKESEVDVEKIRKEIINISTKAQLSSTLNDFPKKDLVRKILLFKLRLNPIEDKEILKDLDEYIRLLENSASKEELEHGWTNLDNMIILFQKILRTEWLKAKQESLR
jgi:hypothetical protein